ncbi:MAG: ATP-binding protein [Rhodocyclales bacterium]|nr:ATP-binding protein [Rhodocyclales bacterium]
MSLSSRILRQVMLVAGGASLLFGMLFLGLYRDQLERERAATSEQINRLLRVALENAMLKRDVPGLREIVRQMGEQPGIAGVMILSPEGEVRFASAAEKMGQQLPQLAASGQPGVPVTRFVHEAGQGEILRSINPVPNQAPCVACHGPLAKHPINGILVVDYDAGTIREQAYRSAALFTAAGIAVLALTLWSIWRLLRRRVIDPLANLDIAANALAAGNLTQRAEVVDADEPGRLATSFNRMAERLVDQIQQGEVQQRYLQELLDGLPDGVRVIRKADYRILTVNAAYCSQLGVVRESVVGSHCYRSSHGREAPCAATMVICPISELQAHGQSVKCRHRHRVVDGRDLPVEVHAVLLVRESEQGREELIVESISDLSHVVRHSQEQRLSELGLLAAGIAHEIHNPLGSMRLAVDGLLRWVRQEQGDPQRLTDYLEMMNAEIDRCTGITQRLLMLSRLPQQQAQIVVLNRAVADTVALLEFDAMSHHIEQRLDLESQELRVLADDSDLRMLVLNLVQNAHHAMPQGGTVTVRTRLAGDKAQIEIVDTGCGIPEDALARIFDPFFSRRADGEGGTGLGLTICQSIVERYGGKIEVASVLAQGTTFRITLPRAVE